MSRGTVKDRFLKERTVDTPRSKAAVELTFKTLGIDDLAYVCSVDHTEQGRLPGFGIDLDFDE